MIKVVKDNTVPRDDIYKSGTIHTGQGEPPNSVSRPTPKPRQVASKPITNGKLLRPGGPKGGPSKFPSRPAAATRPTPQQIPQTPPRTQPATSQLRPIPQTVTTQARPIPQPVAGQARPILQPAAAQARPIPQLVPVINGVNNGRADSSNSVNRAPPPPPPPPPSEPPAARKNIYRVLYDFGGQSQTEISFVQKDELIEVLKMETNGTTNVPGLLIHRTPHANGFSHRLVAC